MLSWHSGTPLYKQVANDLRQQIRDGRWTPGQSMPSIGDLAATYRVGDGTIGKAIRILMSEALVDMTRGNPPSVREEPTRNRIWLRPRETAVVRMPYLPEREAFDIPLGVPVFVIGDHVYRSDEFEVYGGPIAERKVSNRKAVKP